MFFILPVGVDYQARRYPVVTFTLIGLNVVMWLLSLVANAHGTALPGELSEWEMNLWLIPAHSGWHAYLTTLFVHAGFLHLLGNMVYLFLFGSPVEDIIGRWQFVIFYLLGGLVADFAHIAFTPEHFASLMPLGGASGAVSACIGGFMLLLAKTRIEFKYLIILFVRFWSGEFFLPAWLVMSFWFLEDLVFAVLSLGSSGGGTAFGAHVGGFASGMAMIALYQLLQRQWGASAEVDDEQIELEPAPIPMDAATIYLFDGVNQSGPFSSTQISQMLALGSITADAMYWQEGMPDWGSVQELGLE